MIYTNLRFSQRSASVITDDGVSFLSNDNRWTPGCHLEYPTNESGPRSIVESLVSNMEAYPSVVSFRHAARIEKSLEIPLDAEVRPLAACAILHPGAHPQVRS